MTLSNLNLINLPHVCRFALTGFVALILSVLFPTFGVAQAQPTSLSISPSTVSIGQCYTMSVGNGQNMTLDVQYTLYYAAGGSQQFTLLGWPSLDSNGTYTTCPNPNTDLGTYTFTGIRNTQLPFSSFVPVNASVTVTPPQDFSIGITPALRTIAFGQSTTYTVSVIGENGFSSAVSLSVTGLPPGATSSFSPGSITPGQSSTLTITTSSSTLGAYGQFTLTIDGSGGGLSHSNSTTIIVNPPPQPTSFNISPSQAYAGNDPYTVTIGNGQNMIVDLQYTLVDNQSNSSGTVTGTITTNSAGQWTNTLDHYETLGTFTFTGMKNHWHLDWVPVNSVTFVSLPPKPVSLAITPANVTAGQDNYTMTVGNGAAMYLDVKYKLGSGPEQRIDSWPYLDPVTTGSANGQATIPVGDCTPPGAYQYTWIKNHLNGDSTGVSVSATVNVTSAPVVSSVNPASAIQGSSGTVTVNGRNLCSVSLSTTWPGLTITGVTSDSASATATFTVAANAQIGNATINLNAIYGSTSFLFPITNAGAPSVTSVSPTSGSQNTSVSVTLYGANLANATLSTSWTGLSFSNIITAPNGTFLSATFAIGANAPLGNPPIQVTNSLGSTTTTLFLITNAGPPGLFWKKDYIHDERGIVVATAEVNPSQPTDSAPAAPSNLSATVTGIQIHLTWTDNSNNETFFWVGRKRSTEVNYSLIVALSAGTVTYDDFSLPQGTYNYRVWAYRGATASAPSNVATATLASDTQAPTNPNNLTSSAVSSSQINLSWTASSDNVSVTGYRLERCQASGCSSFTQISTPTATTYADTGLSVSTSYTYRVRATDAAGNLSGYSSTTTTSTLADTQAPTAPTNLSAAAAGSSQINLSWTASTDNVGVAGYRLERCQGSGCSNFTQIGTPAATSYSDTGLAVGTGYSYRVRAIDAAGNLSGYSNVATDITFSDTQAPTAPSNLTATTASSSQINLSWTASTDNVGVTGYRVERCQGSGCTNFTQIAAPTAANYNDTGLTASTTYRYQVRATDAAGNLSGYSNIANATTASGGGGSGYQNSRQIQINANQVPSAQPSFPVLVSGQYPYLANGQGVQTQSGIDIKFTSDAAGNNVLPYEQEKYNPNSGEIAYWVKLDSVFDGATFYMFYGNANATDQSNKTAVWDSNFKGVWHLSETTSGSGASKDSTGTANHATAHNSPTLGSAARIGGGLTLNGTSQYLDTTKTDSASIPLGSSAITVEAWIKTTSTSEEVFFAYGSDQGIGVPEYFRLNVNMTATDRLGVRTVAGRRSFDAPGITNGNWHHVVVATAANDTAVNLKVYMDGNLLTSSAENGATASWNVGGGSPIIPVSFGADAAENGSFWSGSIDEVRLSNLLRSADWIRTEFNNQNSPSTFYTIASSGSDTQAPTAPSNLTATAASSSQINLSWTASTDNVGVTGYRVERCQGSGCTNFSQIATPTAASYNDTGLTASTTYRYQVRATDAAGNLSGYSNAATATTSSTSDTLPPTTPSNLTATAANSSQINLSWTASTDNVGVTGYRVERCQGSGCTNFTQIATPTTASYSDTGLTASTTYRYQVRATDAAGNLSGYSNIASAMTTSGGGGSGYQYSRQIQINANQVPSAQPNFPVLVSGTYSYLANGQGVQTPSGIDIKFTSDAAGNNVLPYEQEKYNPNNGEIVYWVKLGSVFDGAIFYMFYGNANATDQSNKTAVWDSNFKGVWHLSETTSGSGASKDSTGAANHATDHNSPTLGTAARIGGGLTLNGTSQYVDTTKTDSASIPLGSSAITVEAWIKTTSTSEEVFFAYGSDQGIGVPEYFRLNLNMTATDRIGIRTVAGRRSFDAPGITNGNWHHVVIATAANDTPVNMKVYMDGNLLTSSAENGATGTWNVGGGSPIVPVSIGADAAESGFFWSGSIDEVRLSNLLRPADWIRTEFNNQSSPSTFYTIASSGDTQPPTAPSNLTATATSSSQINLSWTASTDNVGVTGYRVERCQGSGCTNFTPIATPTTASYSDTGLTASTTYRYQVRATDAAGNLSSYSNIANATTTSGGGGSGYQYSRQIQINANQVPSAQANFPVLVSGLYSYLANGQGVQTVSGIDIKFTSDAAGNNVLPYEQEKYDPTTGQIAYWVKLDSVYDGATFYMFYGNANATDQSNKTAVWDSNFKAVWHLGNGTALNLNDSTSNANNCTNTAVTVVTGQVGTAGNFTRNNSSLLSCGTNSSLAVQSHTVSAWIKINSFDESKGCALILASKSNDITASGIEWCAGRNTSHRLGFAYNDGGIEGWFDNPGNTLATNTWYHVAYVWNVGTVSFYLNGALQGTQSTGTTDPRYASDTFRIGFQANNNAYMDGIIDELKISNSTRSPAWITTEFNNQNAPGSFYTIGPQQ